MRELGYFGPDDGEEITAERLTQLSEKYPRLTPLFQYI